MTRCYIAIPCIECLEIPFVIQMIIARRRVASVELGDPARCIKLNLNESGFNTSESRTWTAVFAKMKMPFYVVFAILV